MGTRLLTVAAVLAVTLACVRPSDEYEVHLFSQGATLDAIQAPPEPMGGRLEWARFRMHGTDLGLGVTGLFGDMPRVDGTSFVVGGAELGYPANEGYDAGWWLAAPGPDAGAGEDACFTRAGDPGLPLISEYVDVGDHIALTASDGTVVRLERDPAVHPNPSGESWYAGYGWTLQPVVQGHSALPDTWRSDASWGLSFPGTVLPEESTMGAIPYPVTGAVIRTPSPVEGLRVGDVTVRAPHHGYSSGGRWIGDDFEDPVEVPGPWTEPVTLQWTPSATGEPLTIALRLLGPGDEGPCGCADDCDVGFSCELGRCRADRGAAGASLGELVCTVADDGLFVLEPDQLETLDAWVDPTATRGAALFVSRIVEGTVEVPDVLTFNRKRVTITPVRTRTADVVVTRVTWP